MFTILGASGFIGSHLVAHLREQGVECFAPDRSCDTIYNRDLGHVVYCIGVTADFRCRPLDTVQAHVCRLVDLIERGKFDSLTYLSSTRIYGGALTGREDERFTVSPQNPNDLYNLSKLMGESICLNSEMHGIRIARLSNVCGGDWSSENFITSIIKSALNDGRIVLHTAPESAKDYISVRDVVSLIPKIAASGRQRIYNVASGVNVSNRELAGKIAQLTGCEERVDETAPTVVYPTINIARAREEFGFSPGSVLESLDALIEQYRRKL